MYSKLVKHLLHVQCRLVERLLHVHAGGLDSADGLHADSGGHA